MSPNFTTDYRRTTASAAEDMINEGGAIRQPSMREAKAVFSRLHGPCSCHAHAWRDWLHNPTTMFWTGFATGLAISLLENHPHEKI
ncbi:hypothetical protein [Prosthecobacter sp.]|uniref:hypothetical protein n=1 Tax=Prosthecobacter sp. TaxID=1965333 RepID=UPI003784263B